MKETLGNTMKGLTIVPPYPQSNGFWYYQDENIGDCKIEHAVVEKADFGRFCNYQGVLCGLSITIKIENGMYCGWNFESMSDIQQFFNKAKATYLKDLIGTPILIACKGNCIRGLAINTKLVTDKEYSGHADHISFFTSMCKILNPPQVK